MAPPPLSPAHLWPVLAAAGRVHRISGSHIYTSHHWTGVTPVFRSGGGAACTGGGGTEAAGARQLLRRGQLVRGPGGRHQHLAPPGGAVWNSEYPPSMNKFWIFVLLLLRISSCPPGTAPWPCTSAARAWWPGWPTSAWPSPRCGSVDIIDTN